MPIALKKFEFLSALCWVKINNSSEVFVKTFYCIIPLLNGSLGTCRAFDFSSSTLRDLNVWSSLCWLKIVVGDIED